MLADFDPDSERLVDQRMVAGGPDVPVFQPEFSPDGRWLSCILGENEEDVFCLIDLETGERQVLLQEVGLLPPAWVQGERSYAWGAAGQTIYLLRNQSGKSSLVRQALDGSEMETLDTRPYTWLKQLSVSAANESLACIASAPGISDQIITWEAGQIKVHRRSLPEMIDPADASQPQPIEWLAPTGSCVFGLYYPPCNPAYTSEGLPPAVVHIHGGPTSQHVMNFDPETGFFTSRGYAYLAVNYRGSTGYGRDYERLLNGHWGEYDIEDAVGSARAMADQGLADPGKIVIEGSSAGGYTVLNALIHHPGRFKAGVSSYGVADLFNLARDSHKFEAHYLDSLVGPLPETSARYHAWSPVNSLDKIRDPMAVFHGKQDKVVPPVQSENLVQALQARHIPHIYYAFDGEGHGFRKSTSLEVYYREVERFLQDWVIFG
jgi:dipeptidyl aminopeptidase/acylaminoacyl peptidase